MIRKAFAIGCKTAFAKFALGPPTQVDQFIADVEQGKDVAPEPALPPAALDGTIPMPPLPSLNAGSTVAPELAGAPSPPPPTMNSLE